MRGIIDILIFLSAFLAVAYSIQLAFYYSKKSGKTQMKFRTFRALYLVAPDKWKLFRNRDLDTPYDNPKYSVNGGLWTIYMSTLAGHIRYCLFVKTVKRKMLKDEDSRNMEILAGCWQQDIEKYKKEILQLGKGRE